MSWPSSRPNHPSTQIGTGSVPPHFDAQTASPILCMTPLFHFEPEFCKRSSPIRLAKNLRPTAIVGTPIKSKRYFQKRRFLYLASIKTLVPGMLGITALFLHAADLSLQVLQKQLKAAEEADDNPAIVELSRRIVEVDPKNSKAWETLARKQVELDDLDRCASTLDAWQARIRPRPRIIDDIRGDLANAGKDYVAAEHYWSSYIAANPEATDTLEKLARLDEASERWQEAADLRTHALAQSKTGARLIARANDYLQLRSWRRAFADADQANVLEPSDAVVKDALPRFELLRRFLPRIESLDAQIARAPAAPLLWLDRARLLTLGEHPALALRDCEHAMKLAPWMMRARIQNGEALLDLGRIDDAANLGLSYDLLRDKNKHLSDEALRALGSSDDLVLKNPDHPEPFLARANVLYQIKQYTLALADAQTALKLDPSSASAHLQAANALDSLDRPHEAIAHAEKTTLLNPGDAVGWYYRGLLEAKRANFDAAIQCQSRSLAIKESNAALLEREKCERRIGRIADADVDAQRRKQLPLLQK